MGQSGITTLSGPHHNGLGFGTGRSWSLCDQSIHLHWHTNCSLRGGPFLGSCPIVPFADRVNAAFQGGWHGWSWMESRRRNSAVLDQQKRGGTEEWNRGRACGTEQISTHSFEKKLTLSCLLLENTHFVFPTPHSKTFDAHSAGKTILDIQNVFGSNPKCLRVLGQTVQVFC